MATKRRAGLLQISVNGVRHDMVGDFSYNLGLPKRTAQIGPDSVHGYQEEPQVAFIEGKLRDSTKVNLAELQAIEGATVVLELARGPEGPQKTIVLSDAWNAAEGGVAANTAEIDVRFESSQQAEEIV